MAKCEKCDTEIMWLRHKETGNPAPIEAAPSPKGNIFTQGGLYRLAAAEEIEKAKQIGKPLFLNHFAACPAADEFRPAKEEKTKPPVPVCGVCESEMNLIENNTLWFCPFGCSKQAAARKL